MVKSFEHKGLERFFHTGSKRGINAQHANRLERLLDRLDASVLPEDMDLPGFGFHALKHNRERVFFSQGHG